MRIVVSVLAGVGVAALSFFISKYFNLAQWASTVISLGTGAVVFVGGALDFIKKFLEVMKLGYEVRGKQREEKALREADEQKNSLILKPTAEDITKFGVSYEERPIDRRIKRAEKERVDAKGFIVDSRDL